RVCAVDRRGLSQPSFGIAQLGIDGLPTLRLSETLTGLKDGRAALSAGGDRYVPTPVRRPPHCRGARLCRLEVGLQRSDRSLLGDARALALQPFDPHGQRLYAEGVPSPRRRHVGNV